MFVHKGPINNIPALVQIMAWCRSANKPLSEPMVVSSLIHIWVTHPNELILQASVPFGQIKAEQRPMH